MKETRVVSSGPGREPLAVKAPVQIAPQPVGFSHRQHGQLQLECAVCHPTASTGEVAQIPEVADCMNCHQTTKKDSPAIQKLISYQRVNKPVRWIRLYKLPEFVFFSHQKHVAANVECQTCHGQVQSRDVLWQEKEISMEACVSCHKLRSASVDCSVCHVMEH